MDEFSLIRIGQEMPNLLGDSFNELIKLRRMCKKLHRLCERYCNEGDFNYSLIEKQDKKIKQKIGDLQAILKIKLVEIQHDPRGWEVKTNNYWINQFIYSKR